MVLDKGYIREFDTPANLLKKKNSIFYSMAKDANLVQTIYNTWNGIDFKL